MEDQGPDRPQHIGVPEPLPVFVPPPHPTIMFPTQEPVQVTLGDYKGYDVHAYTNDMRVKVTQLIEKQKLSQVPFSEEEFKALVQDLSAYYGPQVQMTLINLQSNFREGILCDPELPQFNVLPLIRWLFDNRRDLLLETLIEVGMTCIQGITHRLVWLYWATTEDE